MAVGSLMSWLIPSRSRASVPASATRMQSLNWWSVLHQLAEDGHLPEHLAAKLMAEAHFCVPHETTALLLTVGLVRFVHVRNADRCAFIYADTAQRQRTAAASDSRPNHVITESSDLCNAWREKKGGIQEWHLLCRTQPLIHRQPWWNRQTVNSTTRILQRERMTGKRSCSRSTRFPSDSAPRPRGPYGFSEPKV